MSHLFRGSGFVGQDALLQDLSKKIEHAVGSCVAVAGPGGIGYVTCSLHDPNTKSLQASPPWFAHSLAHYNKRLPRERSSGWMPPLVISCRPISMQWHIVYQHHTPRVPIQGIHLLS
jgi:hypothetical protein